MKEELMKAVKKMKKRTKDWTWISTTEYEEETDDEESEDEESEDEEDEDFVQECAYCHSKCECMCMGDTDSEDDEESEDEETEDEDEETEDEDEEEEENQARFLGDVAKGNDADTWWLENEEKPKWKKMYKEFIDEALGPVVSKKFDDFGYGFTKVGREQYKKASTTADSKMRKIINHCQKKFGGTWSVSR